MEVIPSPSSWFTLNPVDVLGELPVEYVTPDRIQQGWYELYRAFAVEDWINMQTDNHQSIHTCVCICVNVYEGSVFEAGF